MNKTLEERINRKLRRELGELVVRSIEDPKVIEIMLNSDGSLWIERLGKGMHLEGYMEPVSAHSLMSTIATSLGTYVSKENPILEGELSLDGSRFEGMIPPVVSRPIFAIRKKASKVFTINDYVEQQIMSEPQASAIHFAVQDHKNILVVGGTGSGKTTLTNAIINQIVQLTPDDRLVVIEDTAEIQCSADNAVILRSTDSVDMGRLLKATMRLRPDRILVGEVRGAEALTLLKSWNTGHPGGIATVHANSAHAGLTRIEQLIGEISSRPMNHLIAEAIDLIIFIEKSKKGRKVKQIIEVNGFDTKTNQYKTKEIKE